MKTIDQIKQEVEEFLLSGMTFEYILKSNPNLYEDKLILLNSENDHDDQEFRLTHINFKYESEGIKFIGEPIIFKFPENDSGICNYYDALYISDFEFNGFIYKIELNPIVLKLEATLRIFTRSLKVPSVNGWIEIPKIINLLDKDSYIIWDRDDKQKELQKLQDQLHLKLI
jgi:hypothetical protein